MVFYSFILLAPVEPQQQVDDFEKRYEHLAQKKREACNFEGEQEYQRYMVVLFALREEIEASLLDEETSLQTSMVKRGLLRNDEDPTGLEKKAKAKREENKKALLYKEEYEYLELVRRRRTLIEKIDDDLKRGEKCLFMREKYFVKQRKS